MSCRFSAARSNPSVNIRIDKDVGRVQGVGEGLYAITDDQGYSRETRPRAVRLWNGGRCCTG